MTLVPCTASPCPGAVFPGAPGIEVIENAIYRPLRGPAMDADTSWGIYDQGGALVDAAAYRRGPGTPALLGQSPRRRGKVLHATEQTFVYGGVFIDHFGHFLLSTLARLWPFADPFLQASLDPFPVLFHSASPRAEWLRPGYVRELLDALGLAPTRLVLLDEPTRIRRLIVPRPAVVEMASVHQAFLRLTRTIGARLAAVPDRGGPAWLSRTLLPVGTQGFDNEPDLEAALVRRGVEIVHPEQAPVRAMAGLFAGRPVVAGTVGSAFNAALFCPNPAPMVVLSPSPVVNPSFGMLDRLAGHQADYVHTAADHLGIDLGRRLWSAFRLRDPEATAAALARRMQELARRA